LPIARASPRCFPRSGFPPWSHLAAQAGVRHSLVDPHAYAESNLTGFLNVLEGCRQTACRHLVYASSSSVYGGNSKIPFSTSDNVDHPLNLYGATKKANELMAHAYAHPVRAAGNGLALFSPCTGRGDGPIWRWAVHAGDPSRGNRSACSITDR
jgi:UDP-glucuronate 4-epimerase